MTYFCKNCGAVVTGKFCSCCGTKVTTDLADYRKMMNRKRRSFVNQCFFADGGNRSLPLAQAAWAVAERSLESVQGFTIDTFPLIAADIYSKIPEMEKKAAKFYEVITATADIIFGKEAK